MKSLVFLAAIATVSTSFDIRSLDAAQRSTICNNQIASCDVFCSGRTDANTCDSKSMGWTCVCKGGRVPSDTEITFPVPYFQCSGNYEECARGCSKNSATGAEQTCIDGCEKQFKCGNLDPSVMKNVTDQAPDLPKKKKAADEGLDDNGAAAAQAVIGASFIGFFGTLLL